MMHLISFVLLILLITTQLEAQDLHKEAFLAYQAGDLDKAEKMFAELSENSVNPWNNAVFNYDRALVLMAQRKWNEAIALLQNIPLGESPNPLLEFRIYNNIAMSLYELGRSYQGPAQAELSHFAYQEALEYIEDAQSAFCRLQTAEGAKDCKTSGELTKLKSETEKKIQVLPPINSISSLEKGKGTRELLTYLIQQQRMNVMLSRKKQSKETEKEVIEKQKQIVNDAKELFAVALEDAKNRFRNMSEPNIEQRCQSHPWDEFFPAFEKGLKSAESAVVLKGKRQLYKEVETYFFWQNALLILQKPKNEFSGKCPQNSEEKKKIDKTFEQLQQMDQEDRPQQRPQQVNYQGVQPW